MTERVVCVLEVVEVDEVGGDRITHPPRAEEHLLSPVEDQLAIRQTGQRVVQRPVRQQRLELLALGDVTHVGDEAAHRGPIAQVGQYRLDVAPRAVLAHHPGLETDPFSLLVPITEHGSRTVVVVRMHEVECRLAGHLVGVETEELDDRGARVREDSRLVDHDGRVGGVLDERPEPVLAQTERGLGLFLLLHRHPGHADDEHENEGAHPGERIGLSDGEHESAPNPG